MKWLFAIAMLGVSVLSSVPCSAVTLTYNIIYFQPPGGGTRIPHVGNAGGFAPLGVGGYPFSVPGYPSGSTPVPLLGGTPTLNIGGATYALAYASVLGGNEGGVTAFPDSSGALPANVTVEIGSSNITVNTVYFPLGGPCGKPPCPPGSGAWLGELDELSGDLLWDYFVTVYSPQSATTQNTSLTNTGNIYGTVTTTSADVRINAYANTTTGGAFDRWTSEPVMPNVPTTRDLDVNMGTGTTGLAAYHPPCPGGYSWDAEPYVSQCKAGGFKLPDIPRLCAIMGCLLKYIDKGDPAPDRFREGIVVVGGEIVGVAERGGIVAEVFVSRGSAVAFIGARTARIVETDERKGFGNRDVGASQRGHVLTGLALERNGRFFGTLYTSGTISRGDAAKAGLRVGMQ